MTESELVISNMILTGRLNKKISVTKLIKNSKWIWEINNEDMSPIYSVRIIKDKKVLNIHKKSKSVYVSLWSSGAINIVGVTSFSEGKKIYEMVLKELKRIGALSGKVIS